MDKQFTDWQDRTVACATAQNVLPGESPDSYQQLWNTWLQEYQPEGDADLDLLAAVVNAAWRLRRTEKALLDVERALLLHANDASEWPRAQMINLSRMQRSHALAESSLHKNLRLVEFMKAKNDLRVKNVVETVNGWQHYHPKLANVLKEAKIDLAQIAVLNLNRKPSAKPEVKPDSKLPAAPLTRAQHLFSGQNNTKKRKKIARLEQWVEVRVLNGKTITELYPSNAKVMERGKSMLPPPEFVYRRLNFPDGIPSEYNWVGITGDEHRQRGGMGIQRMTVDTWLTLIEEEAARGDGHLNPTANLPRPEEHGGCDCRVCSTNREILEGVETLDGIEDESGPAVT